MEPELTAIEMLISELEAQLQSLRHGLGAVQQKLQDLAELPGHWMEEAKNAARDQSN
jgi:hypothetical protein